MEIIFSNKLSIALQEVKNNFTSGKETAKHPLIKSESIALMKKGFFEIKEIFQEFENQVNLTEKNLDFAMGKYVVSGHVFSHLWGSLYPSESGAISRPIPQLFIVRRANYLKCGISLSVDGHKDSRMVKSIISFYDDRKEKINLLQIKGFDFTKEIEGDDAISPTTFGRLVKIEPNSLAVSKEQIIADLMDLYPLYCELVNQFRTAGLLKSEAAEEIGENVISKMSWRQQWQKWWSTSFSDEFESLIVPDYLKTEFPVGFSSQKQRWEIGRRESLSAIEEAKKNESNSQKLKSLISGSLKRTGFSGAWRGDVEKNATSILKEIDLFGKAHPTGCNDQELEALLVNVKTICGYRVESYVTRILCDLYPNSYMPISAFTCDALAAAADLIGVPDFNLEDNEYHNICSAAKILAEKTTIFGSTTIDLYSFDHFLFWVNKYYQPEFNQKKNTKYWTIAAGEDSRLWENFKKEAVIAIGWDELGDLNKFNDLDSLKTAYANTFKPKNQPRMNTRALYEFKNIINIGDVVFVKSGRDALLGVGFVKSDYIYDLTRLEYRSVRKVEWIKTGNWKTNEISKFDVKTLTNITPYPSFIKKLASLAGIELDGLKIDSAVEHIYDIGAALQKIYVPENEFRNMLDFLKFKKNIILEGPPGVGKTFVARELANCITNGNSNLIEFVQFHQSYSYEDFVQGIRPNDTGGFYVADGVFYRFCQLAKNSKGNFVFIIDEINRGNLSKIFGELLMLIEEDKRDQSISLTYSKTGEKFYIPDNVHIIGTMNTADRGLSLVDYALRRRFAFFKLRPQFESERFRLNLMKQGITESNFLRLTSAISSLNKEIESDKKYLGEGFLVGHAYFKTKPENKTFEEWFSGVVKFEIEPLLKEYWYDSQENLERVLNNLKSA